MTTEQERIFEQPGFNEEQKEQARLALEHHVTIV